MEETKAGAGGGGLSSAEAALRLRQLGPNSTPEERQHPFVRLVSRLWGPIPWLIELAIGLELALGHASEAAILAVLLVFNAAVGWLQEGRAQGAVSALMTRLSSQVRVLRDGSWITIPSEALVPGDLVHLRAGDLVPADGALASGEVMLDQSTVTGESAPIEAARGVQAFAGSLVQRGEADMSITATGNRTRSGRAATLVSRPDRRSQIEAVVLGVVRALLVVVAVFAVAALIGGYARGLDWGLLTSFTLALLVAAIPAALPAAFALSAAIGSRDLARHGVLVTRLSAVEDAALMDVLCSDKTGTLTANRLTIHGVTPLNGTSADNVLRAAVIASDASTQDPLDLALLAAAPSPYEPFQRLEFVGFDPQTRRSEAVVLRNGVRVRVYKGAPATIAAIAKTVEPVAEVATLAAAGERVLAVGEQTDGRDDAQLLGLIGFADPPRPDSRKLVGELNSLGVRVIMLTGDTPETARSVAADVGISGAICSVTGGLVEPMQCGVFAGVYPDEKVQIVAALQAHGHVVGMTGDGVNDAPALRRADVGIAVATATDAAKSAASAVLTEPGLSNVLTAVQEGRRIYQRMLTYTLNKIVKTFHITIFLVLGLLFTGEFVTSSSLVLFLVLANDFGSLAIAEDRVAYSRKPNRWTVVPIAAASLALAGGWVAFSLGALWAMKAHWQPALGELQSVNFVLLAVSGQLTVLMVRTQGFAWRSRPGKPLLVIAPAVIVAVAAVALSGTLAPAPPLTLLSAAILGLLLFAFVLDAAKVWLFKRLGVR